MEKIQELYSNRFSGLEEYRKKIWQIILHQCLNRLIGSPESVLDLGAGYGEFINAVRAPCRYAMDLNPETKKRIDPGVIFYYQNSSERWPLGDESLDLVFSSNFFEHLPDKSVLEGTLKEAKRCLRRGGKLIAIGPNIRFLAGEYWDFYDHHIPLSDRSLAEALRAFGFTVELQIPRFLPYTMSNEPSLPPWLVGIYLRFQFLWKIFGRQFLLLAAKG